MTKEPELHGETTEFLDGRVKVAKWGAKNAEISKEELAAIRTSLDTLNSSSGARSDDGSIQVIGGKELLGLLTKKDPLLILLNDSGVNASKRNGERLLTIDIASNVYFNNRANGGGWMRVSLERKLAHEMGHAILLRRDARNINVKATDLLMSNINGTQRKSYNNFSTWCISCLF